MPPKRSISGAIRVVAHSPKVVFVPPSIHAVVEEGGVVHARKRRAIADSISLFWFGGPDANNPFNFEEIRPRTEGIVFS